MLEKTAKKRNTDLSKLQRHRISLFSSTK